MGSVCEDPASGVCEDMPGVCPEGGSKGRLGMLLALLGVVRVELMVRYSSSARMVRPLPIRQ